MRSTPRKFMPSFDPQLRQFDALSTLLDAEALDDLEPAVREARLAALRDQARQQVDEQVAADIQAQRAAHEKDLAARSKTLAQLVAKAEAAAAEARKAADDARALIDGIDDPEAALVHRLENLTRSLGA